MVMLGTAAQPSADAGPEELGRFYRLSDPGLSYLPLGQLLRELLIRVQEILAVDTVAILLIDDERTSLVARAARGLEEEVDRGVRIPIGKGFAGRIAAERAPIFIADVKHGDVLNPILREKGVRSLLGVPLIVEGEVIGVLHVGALELREFTDEDAGVLQLAAARIAPAIERARLFDALEHEHRIAVALQRSLLPERLPEIVGVGVASRYQPARDEVGGDWYDIIELAQGRVGIAIGDVAGHGARAAALMGQLRTGLRAYALEDHDPPRVFERLDRLLHTIRERGMATASYGVFDPETSVLRFASAGHPPPAIVPVSGEPRFLEVQPSPPLGTLPYCSYVEAKATVAGGEIVLFYTDGLIEVRGEPLGDGLARLLATVRGAKSAELACQQVTESLVPPGGAADDIAVVALQNAPIPAELKLRFPADPTVLARIRLILRRWLHEKGAEADESGAIVLACGEACANAIEHAYSPVPASFELEATTSSGLVELAVRDSGRWRPPRGENRGRGLTIIEATMDQLEVRQSANGTEVVMRRRLRR
jgi:anti-sigma regulatory factor (Ser/Thr protein kinase)/putative methionine-R-sulfoxide reductase with GAF domain